MTLAVPRGRMAAMILFEAAAHVAFNNAQIACREPHAPWYHLSVGIFAMIFGVTAAAMPLLRERPGRREKAVWIVSFMFLTAGELWMIHWSDADARSEAAYSECQLEGNFQQVEREDQQQFAQTMQGVNQVFDKTKEAADTARDAINNITGGKTFIVLTRAWGHALDMSPGARPMWIATSHGGDVLHSVSVDISDVDEMQRSLRQHKMGVTYSLIQQLQTVVTLGDFAPAYGRIVDIGLLPRERTARLSMNFFAMNGSWGELYVCREINGRMKVAIKVTRVDKGKEKVILKSIDKGFPLDKLGRPLDEKGQPMWN